MGQIPDDLIPIPTQPWNERPAELPLDVEECRTALWTFRGNISDAANYLKVPSSRLRRFVANSPYLSREQAEAREVLKDLAENIIYEALTDEDPGRKDAMARFVLNSIGKDRGYGTAAKGVNVSLPGGGSGAVTISWEDGTNIGNNSSKVIDHEAAE